MKFDNLPVREHDISRRLGRPMRSPVRAYPLSELGIDQAQFINTFSPLFEELAWDPYDVRRLKIELLLKELPTHKESIQEVFQDYYTGKLEESVLDPFKKALSPEALQELEALKPWRRRSVARFKVSDSQIERKPVPAFQQSVSSDDIRSWPRGFMDAPASHVEIPLFQNWIREIHKLVKEVNSQASSLEITVHFMSVQATEKKPGDNSPEGAHEDGAHFIVSALVINRNNLKGGESQILEKLDNGKKEIIFAHTLQPGEFIFQADTGEEITYGNDLWHHVTPFSIKDPDAGEGWRDIIGLDIVILNP